MTDRRAIHISDHAPFFGFRNLETKKVRLSHSLFLLVEHLHFTKNVEPLHFGSHGIAHNETGSEEKSLDRFSRRRYTFVVARQATRQQRKQKATKVVAMPQQRFYRNNKIELQRPKHMRFLRQSDSFVSFDFAARVRFSNASFGQTSERSKNLGLSRASQRFSHFFVRSQRHCKE